jgi:hypothetical protein
MLLQSFERHTKGVSVEDVEAVLYKRIQSVTCNSAAVVEQ